MRYFYTENGSEKKNDDDENNNGSKNKSKFGETIDLFYLTIFTLKYLKLA